MIIINRKAAVFFIKLILAAILLLPQIAVSYTQDSLKVLLDDIKEKSSSIRALSCEFTQQRDLALFQNPIIFHGKLAIIRPDKLRWEFISPVPSSLIFNGRTGIRCTDGSKPVNFDLKRDPVMQMVAKQLWTWLDGDYSTLQNEYDITQSGESAILVKPVIKQTADIIEDISITFDPLSRQVTEVAIKEPGGDQTRISFFHYQLNPQLPPKTFTDCNPRD